MKSVKLCRFLSVFLIVAVLVCSLPICFGVSAAEELTTIDYSSVTAKNKLNINDYYEMLGMYDGVGLRISGSAIIVDPDWYWQLNTVDTNVTTTGAYAIYNVAGNSTFTANFSSWLTPAKMSFYVSGDMVTWTLAETSVANLSKTANVTVPQNAKYVKILWPLGSSSSNALVSVSFKKGEAESNFKRIDYALRKPGKNYYFSNGKTYETVLANYGVWEAKGLYLNTTGIIAPGWSELDSAKTANSYNGYLTYNVTPGTRFGLSATCNRTAFDTITTRMGVDPLAWGMEIYISADNVNFERLEVAPFYSARYPNNQDGGDAKRSIDIDFIVPDGMFYVKCKFPMTQRLDYVTGADGETKLWEWVGNDILEINKVEFTAPYCIAKYDYYANKGADSNYVKSTLSAENYYNFGISSANGITYKGDSAGMGLDVDYYFLWNGGYNAHVTYDVEKGTLFSALMRIGYPGGLKGYVNKVGSYTVKLQGYDSEKDTWVDVDELIFDNENNVYDGSEYFTLNMTADENVYNKVRVFWPNKYSRDPNFVGNNLVCIAEASFTPFDDSKLLQGDYNEDNKFNIIDLVRYKKILGNASKEGLHKTDINRNGKSDSADLVLLKQYYMDKIMELKDYNFNGSISFEVLNNYLDRAVSYNFDIASFDGAKVDEGIRFITDIGAKYIQRAAGEWFPQKATEAYYPDMKEKLSKAHAIDPDIIFEAAIFETNGDFVEQFRIPQEVADLFGASDRGGNNFSNGDMLFDDEDCVANNGGGYWGGGAHLPDITKTETQMFVYYKATKYIDMGFEALHLGQTGKTGLADTNNAAWENVISKIRDYAKTHARRGYVLINSHDDADFVGGNGAKLVDFTMSPSRIKPVDDAVYYEPTEENPQKCGIFYGYDNAPYCTGVSGTSPSGWYADKYPYLVEFDNYGNGEGYTWNVDEISWFGKQPSWYRNYFLDYMTDKIDNYFENGHVSLPAKRGGGYYAIRPSELFPTGANDEETYKAILAK